MLHGLCEDFSRTFTSILSSAMYSKEDSLNMDHQMKLTFQKMNDLRKKKELCDIVLQVGLREIYAHKVILASFSPYFHAMFTSDLAESRQGTIALKEVNANSVELLVDFAYTAQIEISESTVQSLLPVAAMFQISTVLEGCCVFLESQLDPSNCIGIRYFAEIYGCANLASAATNFCFRNFLDVVKHEEFLNLSKDQLTFYISRDEVFVNSEDEVLSALLDWVHHDVEQRVDCFKELLLYIRLPFVSPGFQKSLTQLCEELQLGPEIQSALIQVLKDRQFHASFMHKRRPPGPTVIYSAGGYLRHSLDILECFNPDLNKWMSLSPLSIPRSGVGAAYLDNLLYIIGGRNNTPKGNTDSTLFDRYDPMTNKWTTLAPLIFARNRVAVGVLDGQIYAVGGGSGSGIHSSLERYNPTANKWTIMASMNSERIGACVAVLNNKLYAIGGYDGTSRLRSVERYDPETDNWTEVAPMVEQRSGAGAVALNGLVYIMGGYNGDRQLSSVEQYNPDSDTWRLVCPMMHRRSALSVAVVNGRPYAVGGYDGEGFLSSMEVYDPVSDSWKLSIDLTVGRSGAGVAVGWKPNL